MKECSIGDGVGNEGAGMEVPPNSKREGSSTSIRGGGTLGGEEEGDAAMLSVSFSLSLSITESESAGFITIIVCLVGILLSVLETGLCRKYSQINVQNFKSL